MSSATFLNVVVSGESGETPAPLDCELLTGSTSDTGKMLVLSSSNAPTSPTPPDMTCQGIATLTGFIPANDYYMVNANMSGVGISIALSVMETTFSG